MPNRTDLGGISPATLEAMRWSAARTNALLTALLCHGSVPVADPPDYGRGIPANATDVEEVDIPRYNFWALPVCSIPYAKPSEIHKSVTIHEGLQKLEMVASNYKEQKA